jgi:hypothetical protein
LARRHTLSEKGLAERVCSIDAKVLFCAIIDSKGEIGATASRPGSGAAVPKDQVGIFAKRWNIIRGIDDAGDKFLGPSRSAIIFRKNITLISIDATDGRCVLVGATPEFDMLKVKDLERLVASNS